MIDIDLTKNKQNLGQSLTRRVSVQHGFGVMAGAVLRMTVL
jgi:hypothetical protein